MSVNLSPREFECDNVVDRVISAMEVHGLPAGTLEVEITENLLLQDVERVFDKVRTLRRRGVHVAIDDFGTRYSSLNYLRQFPVSSIKIDQSFIRGLGNDVGAAAIVSAFIGIAEGFGLHLVAEGVETDVQVASLHSLGCDAMQGYHFARPMAAAAVQDMLLAYPAIVC
jgi:EAL domain-containing protein (putative c-di-GMP-specific phosphodiesterase class I)